MTDVICHDYRIPVSIGETITLWGMFDLHMDNSSCDTPKLKQDLQAIIDNPKAYAVCGGDTLDMMFAKFDPRAYPKMLQPHIEASDNPADVAVEYAVEMLKPLAETGRLIGMMIGNHEQTYCDRHKTNVIKRICSLLNVPYLGYECFLRLFFDYGKDGYSPSVRVVRGYLHHGFGGGSPVTKGMIQLERTLGGLQNIDFVMMGHIHKQTFAQEYMRGVTGMFGKGKVAIRSMALAICGGYKFRSDWEVSKGSRLGAIGAGRIYFDAESGGSGMKIVTRVN